MHTFNGVLSYSCYFMISTKGCLNRKNEAVEVLEIDFNQATQVYEDLFTNELWNHINILSSDVVISELVDVAPVQTTIFFSRPVITVLYFSLRKESQQEHQTKQVVALAE